MPAPSLDEAFGQHVLKSGMATAEQLREAMRLQAASAQSGRPITLGEALVKQGAITTRQRETVEGKLGARREQVGDLAHYQLRRKLGEGGMGAVYLAWDAKAGKNVALKVLPRAQAQNETALKRFLREADAATQLHHVNIAQADSLGEDKGYTFYVMEYCEGPNLKERLKREKLLPVDEALRIAVQVARGLKHAHESGFVHRDVKPDNVIVTPQGVAKILDLGLSKNVEDADQSFRTLGGIAVGTPHYISPEQARGEKEIDGRADIYSLGATLYHLVTGDTPFHGSSSFDIITKHLTEQLRDPRDIREEIPERVSHVIRRMMAKKPQDRYQDCDELLMDLELVIDGREPLSGELAANLSSVAASYRKPAMSPPTRRMVMRDPAAEAARRKARLWIGALVAAGLLGIIAVALTTADGGRKAPPPEPVPSASAPAPPRPPPVKAPPAATLPSEPAPASEEPRQAEARRRLQELRRVERDGGLPPEQMRGRYERFAYEYADIPAGREVAREFGFELPVPAPAPAPPPAEEARTPRPEPAPPPAEPAPTAPSDPVLASEEPWKQAVDLLPFVDPAKDAVVGTWGRKDGGLVSDAARFARLEIPYEPPAEYDFRIVFTRQMGSDVVQILSRSGRSFYWDMAADRNRIFGLGTIRGAPAIQIPQNPTAQRRATGLVDGRRHVSIVRVRQDGVQAYLDGKLLAEWKPASGDLGIIPEWRLRSEGALGLGNWESPTTYHAVQLLEVSGAGKPRPRAQAMGARKGNGLLACYHSNTHDFSRAPTLTRVDPVVDFNWGVGTPAPGVSADNFSARWTGQIEPLFSELYTFHALIDDTIRLWVGGQMVISEPGYRPEERTGSMALRAGTRYDIVLEVTEGGGGAMARLFWSSPSTPKQIVPQSQLYSHKTLGIDPKPVPDAGRLREAERKIKELFKAEYAKRTVPELKALSQKLLQTALESQEDAAGYVLLREGRDLAAQAIAIDRALSAVDTMALLYQVDPFVEMAAALALAAKAARAPEEHAAVAEGYLDLVEEAVREDEWDAVRTAGPKAQAAAKSAKNDGLSSRIQARLREVGEVEREHFRAAPAEKALKENPDDPAACLSAGRYRCLVRGEWEKGLPLLAKGSDAALKGAAEADQAASSDASLSLRACEAWLELAEKERAPRARSLLAERAAHWYGRLGPQAGEVNRLSIERRLATLGTGVNLLRLVDLARDSVRGAWQSAAGGIVSPGDPHARVMIPYVPPEEYDLRIAVEQRTRGPDQALYVGLVGGGRQFAATLDGWNGTTSVLLMLDGKIEKNETAFSGELFREGTTSTIECSVRKARVQVRVDGRTVIDWKADYGRLSLEPGLALPRANTLFIGSHHSSYLIRSMTLLPVTGAGGPR